MKLFNTLTRTKEEFEPLKKGVVTMYNCGPTVYDYAHIGNLRSYILADTIRRAFEYTGLKVKQVVNITDVGHIVSDEDEGADKLEVAAKREDKSVEDIIELYSKQFRSILETHLKKEEDGLFPTAERILDEEGLNNLGAEMERRKTEVRGLVKG